MAKDLVDKGDFFVGWCTTSYKSQLEYVQPCQWRTRSCWKGAAAASWKRSVCPAIFSFVSHLTTSMSDEFHSCFNFKSSYYCIIMLLELASNRLSHFYFFWNLIVELHLVANNVHSIRYAAHLLTENEGDDIACENAYLSIIEKPLGWMSSLKAPLYTLHLLLLAFQTMARKRIKHRLSLRQSCSLQRCKMVIISIVRGTHWVPQKRPAWAHQHRWVNVEDRLSSHWKINWKLYQCWVYRTLIFIKSTGPINSCSQPIKNKRTVV